jgi:tetratricopeptide (TPR) repeat protein
MKKFAAFTLLALVFAQCRSPKDTASVVSASDYPYIRTFHSAVRLKAKSQYREAITAFDSCFAVRPTDDAAAYGLAQCYLELNDRSNAAKYTELAAKLDPDNRWYTQELAYMYFEQQKFAESAACFKKLVALEPQNVDWWYGYAEVLKRTNKFNEAIDAYNKMEEQIGSIPDISIQKFNLYVLSKQPDKGVAEINEARKTYPDDISLIAALVDYYFGTRQMEKGQLMLEELVKNDPMNGRAYLLLGELYSKENKKAEAYQAYSKAFAGEGVTIDQKVNVILYYYETQQVIEKEVFELANLLIEKHPADAKGYSVLGDLHVQNKSKAEALKAYKKALEFDDSKYPIWNQVLLMEYENRDFQNLYSDARKAAAIFPSMPNIQLLYTISCNQLGRYTEALNAAEIGKELVINDPALESEFYAQMGESYFMQKNFKQGIVWFEKAIATDPTNLLAKNNYAMNLAISKTDVETANELVQQLLTAAPNNAAFMATKGLVELQKKNYTEALSILKKVNELQPNEANYVEYLGDAAFFSGEVTLAVENWKKAKNLGSKNKTLDKKITDRKYVDPEY